MKKMFVLFAFLSLTTVMFSQEEKNKKIKKVGSLFEVTIYYDNGNVMQHGFLNKDNKLHASWESYNKDGSKKCIATYDNGVKVGTWYYWNNGKRTRVVYKDNKIISVVKLDTIN